MLPRPGPEGMRPDTGGTAGAPLPDLVPFPHTSFLLMVGLADEQAQAVWAPLWGWHLARGMTSQGKVPSLACELVMEVWVTFLGRECLPQL